MKVTIPCITLGVAKTKGITLVYWHRYKRARDLGFNLIPGRLGFYFWIAVGKKGER